MTRRAMFKRFAIIFAVLVVAFVVVGLLLPKTYKVERSLVMKAPPEEIFAIVNSPKRWDSWSPWIARDPSIKNDFSGPEAGVGAKSTWTSENSGNGSQTITVSEPPRHIETQLDFGDMGEAKAYWYLEPKDGGTEVLWGMTGETTGIFGGYFTLLMDGFVGGDYEDGLARLKEQVEG